MQVKNFLYSLLFIIPLIVGCQSQIDGLVESVSTISTLPNGEDAAVLSFNAGCPNLAQVYFSPEDALHAPAFLNEISGVAINPEMPNIQMVHNDSGDGPFIYALDLEGNLIKKFRYNGHGRDVEDIAVGPGPIAGMKYYYIGDIGDNFHVHQRSYIYRVPQPSLQQLASDQNVVTLDTETFKFVYPNDERPDAEALLVDPQTGEIVIIEKVEKSEQVNGVRERVFTLGTDYQSGGVVNLAVNTDVGDLVDYTNQPTTGADYAADLLNGGGIILVRSYADYGSLYKQEAGQSIAQALASEPCLVPVEVSNQGESAAFVRNNQGGVIGYVTIPEDVNALINYFLVVP